MYYRWTDAAENADERINLGDKIGKWYRIKACEFRNHIPSYYWYLRQDYLEIKDESSTPRQVAQRRMWMLQGHVRALVTQQRALVNELKANFPNEFTSYTSHDNVIAEFHADVNTKDTGLLLQKYYPDLFKPATPS